MEYPTINLKHLLALEKIIESAAGDPKYLDPAACPYDEKTIDTIKHILSLTDSVDIARATVREDGPKVGRPRKGPIIPMDEVEKEVEELRKELGQLKIDGQAMETQDRIQILKVRAALVEKIIAMKERVSDVKRFNQFVQTVMSIMQDEIEDPTIREKIIKELGKYAEA